MLELMGTFASMLVLLFIAFMVLCAGLFSVIVATVIIMLPIIVSVAAVILIVKFCMYAIKKRGQPYDT